MDDSPRQADLDAFKKLFWEARKAHWRAWKEASAEDPVHQEALNFAREHHWAWVETILEALRLAYADLNEESLSLILSIKVPLHFDGERFFIEGLARYGLKDFDAAIECYRKALDSPGYADPGNAWYNMGNAYSGKKDFDAAIECYRKALDSPGYDTPGNAWNNMGVALKNKKDFDAAIECYHKALDSPGYDTPGDAWYNMGIALRDKKDFDAAIECYRKALDSPNYDTPGNAWNNMGSAHSDKKDFDAAIECYRKALDSPDYATPGVAWYNMGIARYGLKDFDAAIECYRKALDSPDYATPGDSWNNMGAALKGKEEFDAAIDCFRKALDSPSYDTPGEAWNNMGVAFMDKEDFDAAIDCFRKALDSLDYATPGDAWHNMGAASAEKNDLEAIECYRKALDVPGYDTPHLSRLNLSISLREVGKLAEAEKEIQQVLSEPDKEDQHSRANVLLSLLKDRRQGVELDPEDEALTTPPPSSSPSSQNGPEDEMRRLLLDQKSQYVKYVEREVEKHFDDLTILRGWSSSVTLLEGSADCQWVGGGYFLKWRDCGVVIDPGLDFLDNFHEAGFHATEIHAVIVSHNHPDHNYDLGSLDDLFHEIHRASKTELRKPFFILDEDTASRFPKDERAHRGSPASFSRSDCQLKRWQGPEMGLPITIEHFFVSHGDDVKNAVGLRLRLHQKDGGKDIVIGYTADGKITADLVAQLENCDILIAHVSQPDARELDPKTPDFRKEYHLGYKGAIDLIQKLVAKPKIALIGEFWAGLADLRLPLITGIRLRTGMKAVFPACIGLSLRLPDLTIRCTQCKNQVPFSQIKITPPLKEFGLLGYLCNDCIL